MMFEQLPWNVASKVVEDGECWLYTGGGDVYGVVKVKGKSRLVHRYVFQCVNGPILSGLEVCHTCDRPKCIRPKHLYAGTHEQNIADRQERGRGACGSRQGLSRLTEEQVLAIRAEYKPGVVRQVDLAAKYGVTHSTIGKALRGATWGHV